MSGAHPGNTNRLVHGHTWKGGHSPTYSTWQSMKRRCRPEGKYGLRGIRVCDRWQSFENFLADMGVRPDGATIDRIDNDRGYEPGNCRWADHATQVANRSGKVRKCPEGCACNRHSYTKCEPGCACYKHRPQNRTPEWNAKISESRRAYFVRVRAAMDALT